MVEPSINLIQASEVLALLVGDADDEYKRLDGSGADATRIGRVMTISVNARLRQGEILYRRNQYVEAESCFRTVLDLESKWSIPASTIRVAELGLCKALSAQVDNDKLKVALGTQRKAQHLVEDCATALELDWARRVITECDSVHLKQQNYRAVCQDLTGIWTSKANLASTDLQAFAKHTIKDLGAIPSIHAYDRLRLLRCACLRLKEDPLCKTVERQMLWKFVLQNIRIDHGTDLEDLKSFLERLLELDDPLQQDIEPITAQIKAAEAWLYRRMRLWDDSSAAAMDCLNRFGYDAFFMLKENDSEYDILSILSQTVQHWVTKASTNTQDNSAEARARLLNKARELFVGAATRLGKLKFYPEEAAVLGPLVTVGEVLDRATTQRTVPLKAQRRHTSASSNITISEEPTDVQLCLKMLKRLVETLNNSEEQTEKKKFRCRWSDSFSQTLPLR